MQGIVTAIFALRVYALYGQRKIILVIFMTVAILGTATSIILTFFSQDPSTPPDQGCHLFLSSADASKVAIGWEGLLIVDSLLFSLTLRKAYQICRENGTVWIGKSLLFVFFRDGSIYFLIMTLCNVANIISLHIPGPLQGNLSAFVGCLSVILMSRMILNLHEAAETGIYTSYRDTLSDFEAK
ncbi:hypothetical protein GYMLUDRAFT_969671 [Collybiopsis luxurians FD-317 M1]|uniref:Uncharacterized protein n=1 Tax=Collybiopsis luxurians FD-317 M1 TaxID=944289 RepID=A0A0D0BCS0_9AGAR|nr:hypothetical protein GYMLUDRAFT_969671 [Collybiopsis luxurians FD-317 M1]